MRILLPTVALIAALSPATAQTGQSHSTASDHAIYLNFQDLKWDKIVPELGAGSPEITILHVDQITVRIRGRTRDKGSRVTGILANLGAG
jgi:hypothetical protein